MTCPHFYKPLLSQANCTLDYFPDIIESLSLCAETTRILRIFMQKILYAITLASLAFISGCKWFDSSCNCGHHEQEVATLATQAEVLTAINSDEAFTELLNRSTKEHRAAIVIFSAKWCGACQEAKPRLAQIATEPEMQDKLFAVVDVDKAGGVAKQYGIQGIPTVLFLKNGKEEANNRITGAESVDRYRAAIKKAFEN
jgi:thioredoxin 1